MKHIGYYLNEIARNTNLCYELTDAERKELQRCMLSIYKDVAAVCEKHHLCLMLFAGSALGAVRHQGFIPWDDDLDALMPRSDYTKLMEHFDNELGEKYIFATQGVNSDTMGPWMKIYKKNTLVLTGFEDPNCKISNIGIDIMPIDNAPNNFFIRLIEGLYLDAIPIFPICMRRATWKFHLMVPIFKERSYEDKWL
jgi:lipopolysaccharide cholinephosphotransferase